MTEFFVINAVFAKDENGNLCCTKYPFDRNISGYKGSLSDSIAFKKSLKIEQIFYGQFSI